MTLWLEYIDLRHPERDRKINKSIKIDKKVGNGVLENGNFFFCRV